MSKVVTPVAAPAQTELDRIYQQKFTAETLDLFERFRSRALDDAGLKDYLATLSGKEPGKAQALLDNPSIGVTPDLSTRDGQLAWAAALGHLAQKMPPAAMRRHALWTALTSDARIYGSLSTSARYIDLAISNRNATMDWGTPGSWFYFQPDKNHINIDLFYTLASGFDDDQAPGLFGVSHATAVMMHEVGHSQLTKRFTDAMWALQKAEKTLTDKVDAKQKLTRDEFKELARIRKEFELRMMVMNAAEDNCVNQYAANQGKQFPHDFGKSLNIANVLLQGSGQKLRQASTPDKAPANAIEEAGAALNRLYGALASAFHTTNGLFETDDADTWRRLGIDPDLIVATGPNATAIAKTFLGVTETDFERLMDMAVGPNGLSNLQPRTRDRWLLRGLFNRTVANYSDQRCRIIDTIWDAYAKQYADLLIDQAEADADQAMDQAAQQQQDQQGQGQPGQGGGAGADADADGDAADGPAGGGASGSAQDGAGGEQIQVEGVGGMPAGEKLPAKPNVTGAEGAGDETGDDAGGDDSDDAAKTIRELLKALKEAEKAAGIPSGGPMSDAPDPADMGMKRSTQGGRSRGVDLNQLATTSWVDFRKSINELEPIVGRVVDDFAYIREKQRQSVRKLTRSLEILPRGGNPRERLDMRRHTDFVVKRMTGQKISEDDLRRWRREEVQTEATTTELWILGDGSGSMLDVLDRQSRNGARRIDSAVQSMAILFEAGRRANFDTYVGMWGDDTIRVVAEPNTPEKKIGEGFEKIRNGIHSGTTLTPSFSQAIALSAKGGIDKEGRARNFAGMTHILIISDGELSYSDIDASARMMLDLFKYGPDVSIDIAILGGSGSEMKTVIRKVREENPRAAIDFIEANDPSDIPLQLAARIKKRFELAAGKRAAPDTQKREAFRRAHRSFELH